MKRYLLYIFTAFLMASCERVTTYESPEAMVEGAMKIIRMMTVEELNDLLTGEEIYTLIDVRQKSEHYHGYIPGSVILPRGSLEFQIGNEAFWENEGLYMPLKEEKIILYCRKGSRAVLAAAALVQLGYREVYALEGGWKKWEVTYPDITEKNLEMLEGGGNKEEEDIGGC